MRQWVRISMPKDNELVMVCRSNCSQQVNERTCLLKGPSQSLTVRTEAVSSSPSDCYNDPCTMKHYPRYMFDNKHHPYGRRKHTQAGPCTLQSNLFASLASAFPLCLLNSSSAALTTRRVQQFAPCIQSLVLAKTCYQRGEMLLVCCELTCVSVGTHSVVRVPVSRLQNLLWVYQSC